MVEDDSGIALDENFDFVIGNSGDVDSYSNVKEMHKDLSGIITAYINQNVTGSVLTLNEITEIEADITNFLSNDERVNNVLDVTVERNQRRTLAQIDIEVNSIYGGVEFSVGE